ncbi:CHASE2 domain-containing protein [bacterium]|nr:CHASE2 domain-containing protein [bacterium]
MKSIVVKSLFVISLIGAVILIFQKGYFEKAELVLYDWRLERVSCSVSKTAPIVIVGLTQDFEKQVGEPFSRKFHTQLIDILERENAKVIGFDIYFPSITNKNIDIPLISAIKKSNKTVLPVFSPVRLNKKEGTSYIASEIRSSSPEFNESAISLGHINTIPDIDQLVRRIPAFLQYNDKQYPQISLEMSRIFYEKDEVSFNYSNKFKKYFRFVPLIDDSSIYVKILPNDCIENYFISFEDVLLGKYPKDLFKNKAVIIGQTVVGAKNADLIPTSLGTRFGVLLQASCLYSAITGEYIYRVNKNVIIGLLIIWAILMAFTLFSYSSILNSFLIMVFSGLLVFLSLKGMRILGLFIDVVPFLVMSFSFYLSSIIYSLFSAIKKVTQKERTLKLLYDVEKEITNILSPTEFSYNSDESDFSLFEGEALIKKTPGLTLKTVLTSIGIQYGAIVTVSAFNKYQVLAEEGDFVSKIDMNKIIQEAFEKKEPIIINKIPATSDLKKHNINNMLLLPILSHPRLKVLGIFINKQYAPFSKNNFFSKEELPLISSLTLQSLIAIQNARLNITLKETQLESIFRLSVAIEYRDRETGMHIQRVSEYAGIVAENVGLHKNEVELIKSAMPLHDIGKIAIPDKVLLKPGKLTEEEREVVKQHPLLGAEILKGSKSLLLKASEIIALYHHEKYDGSGYPFGLKGNSIPLYGRIATIADIFDALSSKRVYKDAISFEESKALLISESGTTFDPNFVQAFFKSEKKIKFIMETYKEPE